MGDAATNVLRGRRATRSSGSQNLRRLHRRGHVTCPLLVSLAELPFVGESYFVLVYMHARIVTRTCFVHRTWEWKLSPPSTRRLQCSRNPGIPDRGTATRVDLMIGWWVVRGRGAMLRAAGREAIRLRGAMPRLPIALFFATALFEYALFVAESTLFLVYLFLHRGDFVGVERGRHLGAVLSGSRRHHTGLTLFYCVYLKLHQLATVSETSALVE